MQIDNIVFYRSFYEATLELPKRKQGDFLRAICAYAFDGVEPEYKKGDGIFGFWLLIKPNLDSMIASRINGSKGGRPPKQKGGLLENADENKKGGFEKNDSKIKTYRKGKDKDKDIDIEKEDSKKKRKRFSPPTIEEVKTYATEKNLDVDPQRFVDFYASKGWKVGNTPMKDWKAAARGWSRRDTPKEARADGELEALAAKF